MCAFQDDDCAAHFTTAPAELPFDRDACMGFSTLTFYWMAMHSSTWQVYVNCAPLESTTSSGAKSKYDAGTSCSSTSNSTSTASTEVPSIVMDTPSVTSTTQPTTAPTTSTSTTAPSTPSVTSAPSTSATDESDCGSYDVVGSESDCGSYDIAGSESDCGSYDIAGSESDCGSFDVADRSEDETTQTTSWQTTFDFNAVKSTTNAGTVLPYV